MRLFSRTNQPPAPSGSQYRSMLAWEASRANGGSEAPVGFGRVLFVFLAFLRIRPAPRERRSAHRQGLLAGQLGTPPGLVTHLIAPASTPRLLASTAAPTRGERPRVSRDLDGVGPARPDHVQPRR